MKTEIRTIVRYEIADIFEKTGKNPDTGVFILPKGIYFTTAVHSADGEFFLHLRHMATNVEHILSTYWITEENALTFLYNFNDEILNGVRDYQRTCPCRREFLSD